MISIYFSCRGCKWKVSLTLSSLIFSTLVRKSSSRLVQASLWLSDVSAKKYATASLHTLKCHKWGFIFNLKRQKKNFDLCISVCLTVNEENGQDGGCLLKLKAESILKKIKKLFFTVEAREKLARPLAHRLTSTPSVIPPAIPPSPIHVTWSPPKSTLHHPPIRRRMCARAVLSHDDL